MQQILIGELIFNKTLNLEKTIKDKILEGINLSKINKSNVSGQVIVVKTDQTKEIILENNIGVCAVKDSLLYHSIKPYIRNLYGNPDIRYIIKMKS